MRHARADDLQQIEPLLDQLRGIEGLVERTPGAFYRGSKAFLHFHVDGEDFFCDVKLSGADFDRVLATSVADQQALLEAVRETLARR